jgi:hypothetical protein
MFFHLRLFKIAKPWNQPSYPTTDDWVKKNVVLAYNEVLFSNKEELNYVICSKMDGIRAYHVKTD